MRRPKKGATPASTCVAQIATLRTAGVSRSVLILRRTTPAVSGGLEMPVNIKTTRVKVPGGRVFKDSWMVIAKLYWFLLLNGIATVIILYGLSLIIKVGVIWK